MAATSVPVVSYPPEFLASTRTAYDTVAESYADLLRNELPNKPYDRAMLGAFADLVRNSGPPTVVEAGCGPGRITAHLASLGLDAFGIDLSPVMIAVARRDHPRLRFEQGTLDAIDAEDASLGGVVAWYSIIHTPPALLPTAFTEFHRVLSAGGHLLLAFQVGDERVLLEHGYGHDIQLHAYRLAPERIESLLDDAGFSVQARLVREPGAREKTPQAYLLASKSG